MNHDGARAFAQGCADLELYGASVVDVERIARALPMLTFYFRGEPIGGAITHQDQVHIAIRKDVRNHWLTKESLAALRTFAKGKRALINPANSLAERLAQKMGWTFTGTERTSPTSITYRVYVVPAE